MRVIQAFMLEYNFSPFEKIVVRHVRMIAKLDCKVFISVFWVLANISFRWKFHWLLWEFYLTVLWLTCPFLCDIKRSLWWWLQHCFMIHLVCSEWAVQPMSRGPFQPWGFNLFFLFESKQCRVPNPVCIPSFPLNIKHVLS